VNIVLADMTRNGLLYIVILLKIRWIIQLRQEHGTSSRNNNNDNNIKM